MTARTGMFVDLDAADTGTSPLEARHALGGLWETNGASALDVRLGVVADTALTAVVTGTTGMSYDVRSFKAVTAVSTANGPTVSYNDATVNVATTNAPGSNSRIDVIWCRQHLVTGDGDTDADNDFEISVTQGTAAGSPSVPAIPTGALALAQALVPTGVTATNSGVTFTRAHQWTVARGGVIPIFTAGDLATITAPRTGQTIYDGQGSPIALRTWDGSAWKTSLELVTGAWVAVGSGGGAPAFQNAWANLGSGYQTAGFRKVGEYVECEGVISAGTLAAAAFTLPVGYRPTAIRLFPTDTTTGAAWVEVHPDGTVRPTGGSNASASLDTVKFSTTS